MLPSASDRVALLDTCGLTDQAGRRNVSGVAPPRGALLATVSGSGSALAFPPMTAAGGTYRLCWCAAGFTCDQSEDFRVDFGELLLVTSAKNRFAYPPSTCNLHPAREKI